MSLFQRAHEIVQAKANKALEAAEQPDEMLDLSYEQMLDHLTKVRQALVTVAASRKQIELQEQQLVARVDAERGEVLTEPAVLGVVGQVVRGKDSLRGGGLGGRGLRGRRRGQAGISHRG